MGMLDHWQPVRARARACDVGRSAATVAGSPIAVFRTACGRAGAVADVCPHRRLKLSDGRCCRRPAPVQLPRLDVRRRAAAARAPARRR